VIRVLEVLATLKRAGAETMVTSLVRGMDRARFEPRVVSLYDAFPSGLEPELNEAGIHVSHFGKRAGFDARMFGRLRRAINSFRPHIVHSHSYVMRYVLPAALTASRPKLVHTVHNLARREVDTIGQAIHKVAFRTGATPIAVSDEVAASFRELYGFDAAATIPNGVDTRRFHNPDLRSAWRSAHGFSPDETLFVSVARLEPQKNPLLLVNAFERVPSGQLLLAGEGSLRAALEGKPRVHLLGVRRDTVDLLNACDIFVMASDWEGHPLALIEAMSAGLPVIATTVGGVPGILGDAGILIPPGSAEVLQGAMRQLAEDASLRGRLGHAARERAQRFDVSTMVQAYEDVFQRVAAP
jgi:glycosyltransferase involved in cell wall biosynthesis